MPPSSKPYSGPGAWLDIVRADGTTAHAVGTAKLVRTAFGVGQGDWSSDQWVAFDVAVGVDLTAHRAP